MIQDNENPIYGSSQGFADDKSYTPNLQPSGLRKVKLQVF